MNRRPLARRVAVLSALLLAFLATAGPGGGGRGSGGGGSSSSFSSGGGRWSGSGRGGGRPYVNWPIVIPLTVLFGGWGLLQLLDRRYRIVEIAVALDHGDAYLNALDAWNAAADFSSPGGRFIAHRDLRTVLNAADIHRGWVRVHEASIVHGWLGVRAEELYRRRLAQAGLRDTPAPLGSRPPADDGAACVLGVITAAGALTAVGSGGTDAARGLLPRLGGSFLHKQPFLYVYYAPDPGGRLTHEEAVELLDALHDGRSFAPAATPAPLPVP